MQLSVCVTQGAAGEETWHFWISGCAHSADEVKRGGYLKYPELSFSVFFLGADELAVTLKPSEIHSKVQT